MRAIFLLVMICTPATAAPVPKELKKQQSLVGVWKVESAAIGGKAVGIDPDETDWTIDEQLVLIRQGRNTIQKANPVNRIRLKIDKVSKEIDWTSSLRTDLGRYELADDKLTICLCMNYLPRPTGVDSNEKNYVFVLRRAEK